MGDFVQQMRAKRIPWAWTVTHERRGVCLAAAELGTAGYTPVWVNVPGTYDEVSDLADELNEKLGLSKEAAILIVADTMNRSTREREKREGVVRLKLSREQWELLDAHFRMDAAPGDDIDELASELREQAAD